MTAVLDEVANERARQDARWGQQDHDPPYWVAILTEETGEVAKEVADSLVQALDVDAYRTELIQVAAVAVAAVEALDRGGA